MDPLSDILSALNVKNASSGRLEAGGPWALQFPEYRHVIFGAVAAGTCWLKMAGVAEPVKLESGDCYLLTDGKPFSMGSDLEIEAGQAQPLFQRQVDGIVRYGSGSETIMMGARFTFDETAARLLFDFLPALIHIRATSESAPCVRSVLQLFAHETETLRVGKALMIDHLAHIAFMQTLRAYLAFTERQPVGWLGALSDAQIGAALKLMHGEIARRWTVGTLASAVGMSRSRFALRFKSLVGSAPLDYLAEWRMQQAGRMLRSGQHTVSAVALSTGYESEGAFSNAFKRVMGSRPKQYSKNGARI
jgi:AraC-like DNA-binding protein